MVSLLYKSGLRISEVIVFPGREEVQYTDPAGDVKIQPARDAIPPLKEAAPTSTGTTSASCAPRAVSRRPAGFHPSIDDTLHRWIDARGELGLDGRQPLFCTLRGDQLHAQYVRTLLGRLKDKAGLERRVHFRGLRRTFACELQVVPGC
jgi:site-specific recombinase XerD